MNEIKLVLDTGSLEGAIHDLIGALRELSGAGVACPAPEKTEETVETESAEAATQEAVEAVQPEAPKAPVCTVEDLSRAGAALIDQGKMPQLLELLRDFDVQAVTQLKPEVYPEFLTALRNLGAQL